MKNKQTNDIPPQACTNLSRSLSLSLSLSSFHLSLSVFLQTPRMADPDLASPLIQRQSSDQQEVVISIDDDGGGDDDLGLDLPAGEKPLVENQDPRVSRGFGFDHRNPFGFLSESEPPVLGPTTVDPFRNDTPGVSGLYEAIKIVICLPIALVRLILFGASLAVGYLATKLALAGWKDKHNPMPQWRCRIMWITRICTRCILFSFGSVLLSLISINYPTQQNSVIANLCSPTS